MMKPAKRRIINKLIPYFLIWTGGALIYMLLEYGILGSAEFYPSTGNPYVPGAALWALPLMTLSLTLILGLLEEVYFRRVLRKQSFILRLLTKTILYVFTIAVIIFIITLLVNSNIMDRGLLDPELHKNQLDFITGVAFLSVMVFCAALIILCLFVSEIIDYLGLSIVGHYFTGKYTKPVIEERIFMFLDMKGSTTIAEKIGHQKYYQLINQYYNDMTNAITNTLGEIYQYVGDEIIISWKMKQGLKDLNCVKCFFEIQRAIEINREKYLEQFEIVPSFKSGIHSGRVTRGQVGVIKKEMLFTGDVLNTTARIQGLCNELNTSFLISEELLKQLPDDQFNFSSKGEFELRGRNKSIGLYEITQ